MPLAPTTPLGAPHKTSSTLAYPAATILQTQTVEVGVVGRTGYLTGVSIVPLAGVTGAASPSSRSFTIVCPTTRVVSDGIVAVAGTSAFKGPWASGSYSTGDLVTFYGQVYAAIASVTTEAPTDTTKWQAIHSLGLNYLTSRTGAFTADDVGKTISGTGFTSATIAAVIDSTTVQTSVANSAVRNALSTTIGASRTLATLALVSGNDLVASTAKSFVLDAADVKVYKGDVIQLVSAPVGGTGLADTGGGTVIVGQVSYSEGTAP